MLLASGKMSFSQALLCFVFTDISEIFSEEAQEKESKFKKSIKSRLIVQQVRVYVCNMLLLATVAHLDAPSDWRPGGRGFNPRRDRQYSFKEIDHEIYSTVILSLPLIQEGQLSVSGERMCTILVNRLED